MPRLSYAHIEQSTQNTQPEGWLKEITEEQSEVMARLSKGVVHEVNGRRMMTVICSQKCL